MARLCGVPYWSTAFHLLPISISPPLGISSVVARRYRPRRVSDTVNLQVRVQSKDNLSATSSQVSLEGSAALNVGGAAADPVITGRTDLTSGELFYRNVRYQLQRGIITFSDPNETRPNLDVSVTTTIEQYNLTLNLRGPLDTLTTSYSPTLRLPPLTSSI